MIYVTAFGIDQRMFSSHHKAVWPLAFLKTLREARRDVLLTVHWYSLLNNHRAIKLSLIIQIVQYLRSFLLVSSLCVNQYKCQHESLLMKTGRQFGSNTAKLNISFHFLVPFLPLGNMTSWLLPKHWLCRRSVCILPCNVFLHPTPLPFLYRSPFPLAGTDPVLHLWVTAIWRLQSVSVCFE